MPLLPHRLSVRNTCTLICPSLANTFQTLTVRLPLLRQNGSALWENIQAILIAVLIALFIRTFIVQAFKIPSGSMLPTLQIGDHILVNKFIYGVKLPFTGRTVIPVSEPAVNDVIVFEYPVDPQLDYIKRVIAVAGDVVEIRDKKVFINKKPFVDTHGVFTDPLVHPASLHNRDNFGPVTVPADSLFVMGDNRDNSFDGRFWGFVKRDAIRGEAWRIYWSWDLRLPLLSVERLKSIRWNRIGTAVD